MFVTNCSARIASRRDSPFFRSEAGGGGAGQILHSTMLDLHRSTSFGEGGGMGRKNVTFSFHTPASRRIGDQKVQG